MIDNRGFFLLTLGCKVNQYEGQALREAWVGRGLTERPDASGADTVCINTCAVTANAVADGRAAIRRAHRDNPDAAIIVTGCAAQVFGEELWKEPGVTMVVPQQNKACLLRYGETDLLRACGREGRDDRQNDPAYPLFSITGYDRSRAVLKVQDGCSHRCTYCIVPLTRGRSRSRTPSDTLAEARRLLSAGFRELVLNGINLSQYGRDFSNSLDFWDLVALLDAELAPEWEGKARIRLSSLEPGQLDSKALDVLANSKMVAPHLHLSLQSGSKNVLKRMGRGHYDPNILPAFCKSLAGIFPRFGLGADLLAGFPGETAEDAAETEAFCVELPFSYAHVFPFSRRPGTPAAGWPDQIRPEVKKERAARLRALVEAKKRDFLRRSLELPQTLVACEVADGAAKAEGGVNEFYAECRFKDGVGPDAAAHRSLVPVKPVGMGKAWLWVEVV